MIDHLLQIRVLQIQSVFYKSNPVLLLQYAVFRQNDAGMRVRSLLSYEKISYS